MIRLLVDVPNTIAHEYLADAIARHQLVAIVIPGSPPVTLIATLAGAQEVHT